MLICSVLTAGLLLDANTSSKLKSVLHGQNNIYCFGVSRELDNQRFCPRSPAQSRSELIIAPPPPWPFSCNELSTSESCSTSVVAAFITPKQPNVETVLKKPTNESVTSLFMGERPPRAAAGVGDAINESLNQRPDPGNLFLEEDESKWDSIKRCPSG